MKLDESGKWVLPNVPNQFIILPLTELYLVPSLVPRPVLFKIAITRNMQFGWVR